MGGKPRGSERAHDSAIDELNAADVEFGEALLAGRAPHLAKEAIAALLSHASACEAIEERRRVKNDQLWPEVFTELKRPGRTKDQVREGLRAAVEAALTARVEDKDIIDVRDRLHDRRRAVEALMDAVIQEGTAAADDWTSRPPLKYAFGVAFAGLRDAYAIINSEIARYEGVTATSQRRGRGQKHEDDALVSWCNDVLTAHSFQPMERARFIKKHLPVYWRSVVDDAGDRSAVALQRLAERLGARSRSSPRKSA